MSPAYHQLCLPLGEPKTRAQPRRPIPEEIKEYLALSDSSPSGLIWIKSPTDRNNKIKPGTPAGSLMRNCKNYAYYTIQSKRFGVLFAHRVAYFLQTGIDPGNQVVRHIGENELAVGWQEDNLRDEKGKGKGGVNGYKCKNMYEYQGETYSMPKLCQLLGIPYVSCYRRKQVKPDADPSYIFGGYEGITAVEN